MGRFAVQVSLVLSFASLASALVGQRDGKIGLRGFLALDGKQRMHPELVANQLKKVEEEWSSQARAFIECNSTAEEGEDCSIAPKAFGKSCSTVVSAIVQGSGGQKSDVVEYMGDVCDQRVLEGWMHTRCQSFANLLSTVMDEDTFENREHLNANAVCGHFWGQVSKDERANMEEESAEKAKAEDLNKKVEDAAEADRSKKRAEEETRAEEAKKKAEEAAKIEEEAAKVAEEMVQAKASEIKANQNSDNLVTKEDSTKNEHNATDEPINFKATNRHVPDDSVNQTFVLTNATNVNATNVTLVKRCTENTPENNSTNVTLVKKCPEDTTNTSTENETNTST